MILMNYEKNDQFLFYNCLHLLFHLRYILYNCPVLSHHFNNELLYFPLQEVLEFHKFFQNEVINKMVFKHVLILYYVKYPTIINLHWFLGHKYLYQFHLHGKNDFLHQCVHLFSNKMSLKLKNLCPIFMLFSIDII